jgi:uncharacterized protein
MLGQVHGTGAVRVVDRTSGRRAARIITLCFGLIMPLASGAMQAALADVARGPVRSMVEIRQQGVVVQQWDYSCGAAALATILRYQHADPVPEREVARILLKRDEYLTDPSGFQQQGGFSLLDLKRFADGRGYNGTGYGRLTLRQLVDLAPVIVPVNLNGYNHFVVFRGVLGSRVLLADPAYGNRTLTVSRFERAWLEYPKFGRVGFTVTRRDGVASPGRLRPDRGSLLLVPDVVLRTALPFTTRP